MYEIGVPRNDSTFIINFRCVEFLYTEENKVFSSIPFIRHRPYLQLLIIRFIFTFYFLSNVCRIMSEHYRSLFVNLCPNNAKYCDISKAKKKKNHSKGEQLRENNPTVKMFWETEFIW